MKKKKSAGGSNWMDTYGDMVTLLLCFFVLLYSMSTISEENWKAIVMSFNPDAAPTTLDPEGGTGPSLDADLGAGVVDMPSEKELAEMQDEIDTMIEQLYQAIQNYTAEQGMQDTISVAKDGNMVYVTFNDTAFFDGESFALRDDAIPILDAMSGMLSEAASAINSVRVQGHTAQARPNSPNNPYNDRMLSGQRASAVVWYIQENSTLDPGRLVSEGYGQHHPVSGNDTETERMQNRRVEMIISGRNLEEELLEQSEQYTTTGTSMSSDAGTQPSAS